MICWLGLVMLLLHHLVQAKILLWDHSSRMFTAENVLSPDWLTYSEGSSISIPFSEWTKERMIQEGKTSLFIHFTFVVRDTSTTMLSVANEEDGEVEGCLIDGLYPPLQIPAAVTTSASPGFRIALRNRGTWSSVLVEIPGVTSQLVKTIIVPFSETDVDVQIDFVKNEVVATVNTRNREDGTTVRYKSPTTIPALNTWPEIISFGTDRNSANRFSAKTDWEVYSLSMKMGAYTDLPLNEKEQVLRGRGQIVFRMNDPPVRFPKVIRAKIFESTMENPTASFLRISFSFTLASKWRTWYDGKSKVPADIDSPSILCMAKPVARDARNNLLYPVGLRVWLKVDPATNDSYVNVEVGDGTQYSHRVQIAWPAIQSGIKYNGEFMIFFLANGDADGSRLPLFRFSPAPEDLSSPNTYIEVPKVVATRNHLPLSSWVTARDVDFTAIVVGAPCRGLKEASSVLMDPQQFVVESIEVSREPAFPVGSILIAPSPMFYPPPIGQLLMNAAVPAKSPVSGYRKTVHLRGAEQRDAPRYAMLNSPVNFVESRSGMSQGFLLTGEFLASTCSVFSWARNDSASSPPESLTSPPTLLPILDLHNFLVISVDCARSMQMYVTLRGDTFTDSRFQFTPSTFRNFRLSLNLPDSNSTLQDTMSIQVGNFGTVRYTLTHRLPRQELTFNAMWLGRDQAQRRVYSGKRGWAVRNVELATFQFVPCTSITISDVCASYTDCAYTNKACRPTQAAQQAADAATLAPTLESHAPSASPSAAPVTRSPTATLFPTPANLRTSSPTTARPTTTNSPTFSEYELFTHAPTRPPVKSPTQSPTRNRMEYEYEFEYEYEYEYETTEPPSSISTRSPTHTQSPTTPTRAPSQLPTAPTAPTVPSLAPSRSPSFFVPTEAPDIYVPPTNPPTSTDSPSSSPTVRVEVGSSVSNSSGTAAGLAAGTTLALLGLAGVVIFTYRRKKKRAADPGNAKAGGSPMKQSSRPSKNTSSGETPGDNDFEVL